MLFLQLANTRYPVIKYLKFLLFPFAALYFIVTSIRNFMYDRKILKAHAFDIPSIAVGNLSVGGTGKTPMIEYLVKLLSLDYEVVCLSRGYGRKTKGFLWVEAEAKATEVGDEPLLLKQKFKADIAVAVCEDRVLGVQTILEQIPRPVILLDDAFQHRSLKAGFYILLTAFQKPYAKDWILPVGFLREAARAAQRAHVQVITKIPALKLAVVKENPSDYLRYHEHQSIYYTWIEYGEQFLSNTTPIDLKDFKGKKVAALAGIANPDPFFEHLNQLGLNFERFRFKDHHQFSMEQLKPLKDFDLVVTTEKDFTRIDDKWDGLCYLEMQQKFHENEVLFEEQIKDYITSIYST
ncbi:MAG: tetraacyldisaccharide 4'-kinase [Flavobacteriaceae bacterium]|nr:tetraacyldisaccharide 4'-kinase [Flavobacteriaceae bacterium]